MQLWSSDYSQAKSLHQKWDKYAWDCNICDALGEYFIWKPNLRFQILVRILVDLHIVVIRHHYKILGKLDSGALKFPRGATIYFPAVAAAFFPPGFCTLFFTIRTNSGAAPWTLWRFETFFFWVRNRSLNDRLTSFCVFEEDLTCLSSIKYSIFALLGLSIKDFKSVFLFLIGLQTKKIRP